MAQNYGYNQALNKALAQATGYTGDFGSGQYQTWLSANPDKQSLSDYIMSNPTLYSSGSNSSSPSTITPNITINTNGSGTATSAYDAYTVAALNQGLGMMSKPVSAYPDYVPSQTAAPKTYDFYNYSPTTELQKINQPNYQMTADSGIYGAGLMNTGNGGSARNWGADVDLNKYLASATGYTGDFGGGQYQEWLASRPDLQALSDKVVANYNKNNTYQGLMGSDYAALQQALTTPGQISAQNAYNQGLLNLRDTMGGRGLYGSSVMQNQQTQGLDKVLMDALSTNAAQAAATRYGMEQTDLQKLNEYNLSRRQQNLTRESDLNKYNAQNYATAIGEAKNIWAANAAETANRNAYDAAKLAFNQSQDSLLTDWANKQNYEKYTYNLAKNAYQNQSDEALMNRALALAGQGAPLTQMATNYQLAQQQNEAARQAAADASSANNLKSWMGLASSGLGGLLGTDAADDWLSKLLNG